MSQDVQEGVPDPITSRIVDPIETGNDEQNIRAAMAESQKRREETGQDSNFSDAGVDTRADAHEWSGADAGITDQTPTREALRRATDMVTDTKKRELGAAALRAWGVENPDGSSAYAVADTASTLGRKPSELPLVKRFVADDSGNAHAPLRDHERMLWQKEATGSLADATRAVRNYDEAVIAYEEAQARQAEWDRLQGTEPQQQSVATTPTTPGQVEAREPEVQPQRQASPQPQSAQPQSQPSPQPQSPTKEALTDRALQVASEMQRLTNAELENEVAIRQWRDWAHQNFPELKDAAQLEYVKRYQPQRWGQLEKANQQIQLRQAQNTQIRQANALRQAQVQAIRTEQQKDALVAFKRSEDDKYAAWADKAMPQYRTPEGIQTLRQHVKAVLRDTGLTDAQIQQQWDSGYLRPLGFQQVLAKAAAWHHQQEQIASRNNGALAHKRAQTPAPVAPGYASSVSRGAEDAMADIARLQRQLDSSTGNASLRLAVELTKAKRAAGLL